MTQTIDAAVLRQIVALAVDKGILGGREPAILDRLQGFADGLLPGRLSLPLAAVEDGWRDVRGIGERFSLSVFTSDAARKMAGAYYTPEEVIDAILDLVWDDAFPEGVATRRTTLLDPAMGCGFFLIQALERLLVTNSLIRVRRWAADCLYGVDSDPGAVFMAKALLWLTLSDQRVEFAPGPDSLRLGDSLLGPAFGEAGGSGGLDWAAAFPRVAARGGFSLIVGNPPYEVLTNFRKHPEQMELARAIRESGFYGDGIAGQVNLYRCFCERSLALLRKGGRLSFVVPLSLARDAAALPLRRRLLEREKAERWLLFGEDARLFPGVTQSACIFLARKGGGAAERITVHARGGAVELPLAEIEANSGGALTIPYLGPEEAALWRWLWRNCPGRIADVAEMRVGEVDQTVYRDCMADEDTGCVLLRGNHVSPFVADVRPVPGKERFLRRELFFEKRGGAAEAARERSERWRVVQLGIRNMQTHPRLVAALAPPGVYLGNSLNYYLPAPGTSPEYLAGLLNSRLLDWLFRLGSGNNNINLHEMRRLPFPSAPPEDDVRAVEHAYRGCVAAAERGGGLAEARAALDAAVEWCYGVPAELTGALGCE